MAVLIIWIASTTFILTLSMVLRAVAARLAKPLLRDFIFAAWALAIVAGAAWAAFMTRVVTTQGYEPAWIYPFFLSMAVALALGLVALFVTGGARNLIGQTAAASWPILPIVAASLAPLALVWITIEVAYQFSLPRYAMIKSGAADALIRLSPPRLPDEENAAIFYRQAAQMIDDNSGDHANSLAELIRRLDKKEDGAGEKARAAIAERIAFLDLIKSGASTAGYYSLENPALEMQWPHYNSSYPIFWKNREMAFALALEARLMAAEGKIGPALENVSLIYKLGSHVASDPVFLVSAVFGVVICEIGNNAALMILEQANPAALSAMALPVRLESIDGRIIKKGLLGESAWGRAAMADLAFTIPAPPFPGAKRSGILEAFGLESTGILSYFEGISGKLYITFGLEKDLQFQYLYFEKILELANEPSSKFLKEIEKFEKSVSTQGDDFTTIFHGVEGHRPSALGAFIMSPITPYVQKAYAMEARYYLSRSAMAAQAYRAKNKKYPAAIADLAPDYITSIPTDPFDGQPLKMAAMDNGIVIYSVGPDFADNGGNPAKEGWLGDTGKGEDIVIRLATPSGAPGQKP